MGRGLDVRLRVLIPAVENAVSATAFRPLDVYRSRKGLTVEIGNTDAEGRLILADALALADEERPDLLDRSGHADRARRGSRSGRSCRRSTPTTRRSPRRSAWHAAAENDPLWRMPLWRPYDSMLDSKVADLNNASSTGFAGSIALRAVPPALRQQGQGLAACRYLRLEPDGRSRAARKAANARPRARSTRCCANAMGDGST